MANFKTFFKSGHPPTLLAAFLYFDFSFAIWVLNGAMAPFITKDFHLTKEQAALMITLPTLAGALMRFPLGVISQYIGRKNAALVEMACILAAMVYGFYAVKSYNDVLAMGVLLGVAGASFGVAMALGSGWFPPEYKGLAMGIAGAGNSGTAIATFFAPQLAKAFGWQKVYGFAALLMLLPFLVMLFFAKEPPDREGKHSIVDHIRCLWQPDGWVFNVVYIITFGGFLAFATYLPTYFSDQFHIDPAEGKYYVTIAVLIGSGVRIVGGWAADRYGGVRVLYVVMAGIIVSLLGASFATSLGTTALLLAVCAGAFGMGNGALFQMVPLRWPVNAAVAGGMVGEIGALGGVILPNGLAYAKTNTGSYSGAFVGFAVLAALALITLYVAQRYWIGKWLAPGGRALTASMPSPLADAGEPMPLPDPA